MKCTDPNGGLKILTFFAETLQPALIVLIMDKLFS